MKMPMFYYSQNGYYKECWPHTDEIDNCVVYKHSPYIHNDYIKLMCRVNLVLIHPFQ
jgi:hypothetical protein